MAADKTLIVSWLADLAAAIVLDTADAANLADRFAVAASLDAAGFATEAIDLTRIIAESADSADDFDRLSVPTSISGGDTLDVLGILLALALCISGARIEWPSRPLARKARARVSAAAEAALVTISAMGGDGAALYGWLSSVANVASRLISDLAASAVPIVKVESGISLPSTVLAYRLYSDATRAEGLIDIARAATPMVMPTSFDALAS